MYGYYSRAGYASNFKWKIFSNLVAFSEYPNFTEDLELKTDNKNKSDCLKILEITRILKSFISNSDSII